MLATRLAVAVYLVPTKFARLGEAVERAVQEAVERAVPRVLVNVWPDAGQALSIGRSKAFELVASGELASVRVGRRRLVPVEALHAYADRLLAEQQAG